MDQADYGLQDVLRYLQNISCLQIVSRRHLMPRVVEKCQRFLKTKQIYLALLIQTRAIAAQERLKRCSNLANSIVMYLTIQQQQQQ